VTTVVHPGDSLVPRQRLVYILVLGALTALGPFTVDLYLPAFPVVESEFTTTTAMIQLTLTATTVGFGVGQLFMGPWSDRIGRRLPLVIATTVHVAASIGVAMAPSVGWLIVFRVLQGAGAAGGGVVAVATVRDLFGGRPLVRMLSRLSLVSGLAPVVAPVIGSQLLRVMPWRGIFLALAGYGLVVLVLAWLFIVETLPPARRVEAGHSTTRQRYSALFGDRIFVGIAIVAGLNFSGLFAYLSSSSFLFQDAYKLNAQQFGLIFAINSVGVIIGVQSSSRLARFIGPQWIVAGATAAMTLSALVIVILDLHHAGLFGVLIPLWFFIASVGFTFPMTQVIAIANHPREAGTAASLLGALNFGLAGAVSPIVGLFGIANAVPMGIVMACTSATSAAVLWLVVRPWTVPALAR
jgi:DHA1 family bicyclomycin/chloramphenicol resistance-like MFS transporter